MGACGVGVVANGDQGFTMRNRLVPRHTGKAICR